MTTTVPHRPRPAAAVAYAPQNPPRRIRGRGLLRHTLTMLSSAFVAIPVAIWLAEGGLSHIDSLGAAYQAIGIVAGLVATAAMMLMLFLVARVPVIDRAIGQDHAVALHRELGELTFLGLLAHGVFLVLGYALVDATNPLTEWLTLWGTGDFRLAVLGMGLLAAVAISSVVAVKRQLPHEVWHGIHLLSYVAVAVAIPHQFTMTGLFADGLAFWYWAGMFTLVGFLLLTYRVFLPIATNLEHRLVVSRVIQEAPGVVSIEMTGRHLDRLGIDAGQYLHWRFWGRGLWWHQHPFSTSARPSGDTLRITVRNLGAGTARLMSVRPGTRVSIEGPYGIFTAGSQTRDDLVAVGIGIGIAPVRALLEDVATPPGRGTVVLRASSEQELFLGHEIARICRERGFALYCLTGHRAYAEDGAPQWVPEQYAGLTLADLAPNLADADVYVCGPQPAAELVLADARAHGVRPDQIHNEIFAW